MGPRLPSSVTVIQVGDLGWTSGRGSTRGTARSALRPSGRRAAGRRGRWGKVPQGKRARGPEVGQRIQLLPSPGICVLPPGTQFPSRGLTFPQEARRRGQCPTSPTAGLSPAPGQPRGRPRNSRSGGAADPARPPESRLWETGRSEGSALSEPRAWAERPDLEEVARQRGSATPAAKGQPLRRPESGDARGPLQAALRGAYPDRLAEEKGRHGRRSAHRN